jgi:hypothetical protein
MDEKDADKTSMRHNQSLYSLTPVVCVNLRIAGQTKGDRWIIADILFVITGWFDQNLFLACLGSIKCIFKYEHRSRSSHRPCVHHHSCQDTQNPAEGSVEAFESGVWRGPSNPSGLVLLRSKRARREMVCAVSSSVEDVPLLPMENWFIGLEREESSLGRPTTGAPVWDVVGWMKQQRFPYGQEPVNITKVKPSFESKFGTNTHMVNLSLVFWMAWNVTNVRRVVCELTLDAISTALLFLPVPTDLGFV